MTSASASYAGSTSTRRVRHAVVVRQLLIFALLPLNGCGDRESNALIDAYQSRLSIDLVVTPTHLVGYTNGTVHAPACDDTNYKFAAPGTCQDVDDVILGTCASCLEARLVGTGVSMEIPSFVTTFSAQLPSPYPADLKLVLSGCRHTTVAIPIEAFTPPHATLSTTVNGQMIGAQWTTDIPAASSYVSYGFGFVGHECHTRLARERNV